MLGMLTQTKFNYQPTEKNSRAIGKNKQTNEQQQKEQK